MTFRTALAKIEEIPVKMLIHGVYRDDGRYRKDGLFCAIGACCPSLQNLTRGKNGDSLYALIERKPEGNETSERLKRDLSDLGLSFEEANELQRVSDGCLWGQNSDAACRHRYNTVLAFLRYRVSFEVQS